MNQYKAIVLSINWLAAHGVKTSGYMQRTIDALIRDMYNEKITADEFQDSMFSLVEDQFRRAFNEGMRLNGLDPLEDMTDAFSGEYQRLVTDQLQYIEKFANDITNGVENGASRDEFMNRSELWANQYESTVNEAQLITAHKEDRYVWRFGATEQHCSTCSALDGVVHTAAQWLELGLHPQQPPNGELECGGWHCDCTLELTDDPADPIDG